MKVPFGIALFTVVVTTAIYGYFSIINRPLDLGGVTVVALFSLGVGLVARWLYTRRHKKEAAE